MSETKSNMVNFVYSKDHGSMSKGDERVMHKSTAGALVAHKIGTISNVVKVIKKD